MSEDLLPDVEDSLRQYKSEQSLFALPMTMKEAASSREQELIDEWTTYYGVAVYERRAPLETKHCYSLTDVYSFQDGMSVRMVHCSNPDCPSKNDRFSKKVHPGCDKEAIKLRRERLIALHKGNAQKAKKYDALTRNVWSLIAISKGYPGIVLD